MTGGGNVDANVGRLDGGEMAAIVVPIMIVVLIIAVVIVIAIAVVAIYRLRRCDTPFLFSLHCLCEYIPHPRSPFSHTIHANMLPSILTARNIFLC